MSITTPITLRISSADSVVAALLVLLAMDGQLEAATTLALGIPGNPGAAAFLRWGAAFDRCKAAAIASDYLETGKDMLVLKPREIIELRRARLALSDMARLSRPFSLRNIQAAEPATIATASGWE